MLVGVKDDRACARQETAFGLERGGKDEEEALRIDPICQEVAREALKVVRLHDENLAGQLARAGTSIPLDVSEGSYSRGGNRNSRYHTAMGSAAETRTIVELVEGDGWAARDEEQHARLRQIIGTLVRVLRLA